jgi:hypothetical protein
LAALSIRKALAQNNEKFKKGRVRKRDRLASMLTLPFSPPAEATSKTSQRKTLFLHFSGPTGCYLLPCRNVALYRLCFSDVCVPDIIA